MSENKTKTIEITTILLDGPKSLENWSDNFTQSNTIIKSLKEGDKLLYSL